VPYQRGHDTTLSYSRPFRHFTLGAEYFAGRNVFGDDFSRVAAFIRYADNAPTFTSFDADPEGAVDRSAEVFVDAGVSSHKVRIDLDATSSTSQTNFAPHFALGARRAVSDRSDLGVRVEVDEVDGHTLLGVRALDYRFRFASPLALGVFIGASRYSVATPAYGLSYGAGLQWRDVRRGWDLGIDLRNAKKVARDHLLPEDPSSALRPDSFYTIDSYTLSVTKRFH
jgi:hypothetical protein